MTDDKPKAVASNALLDEIRDCQEVFISGNPIPQYDALEPRHKIVIAGPARLVEKLLEILTSNPTGLRCAGLDAHKQDQVVQPSESKGEI